MPTQNRPGCGRRRRCPRGPSVANEDSRGQSYEVVGLDSAPFGVEIFRDEPAMAVMRQVLTAKQATVVKHVRSNELFDLPLRHHILKFLFVDAPIAFLLFIRIKDVLRRCEFGQMDVFNAADFFEEVSQIILFGKASELGVVVQPHVHDPLYACVLQFREEITRGRLGESDGEKFNSHIAGVLRATPSLPRGRRPSRLAFCKPRQ